jgi:lipase
MGATEDAASRRPAPHRDLDFIASRALHVEEWGPPDGARIVCLHGVTSHGRHFAKLAEALPGYHVLAPDLLGHGSSPYEPPWGIADHIDAVVEGVGAAAALLVGHSFGGRIAFEIAARAPRLVPRLVLLDPAIRVPPPIALFAAENARKDRVYVSFEEGIDRRYDESQLHRAPRELLVEELRGHLVWSDDEHGYRYRYSQSAVVAAYGELASEPPPFERVRVPTLLVLGERSYLPYDHLLAGHRAALGDLLEVVVVPGGHTVLWDAFEETAEAVAGFLGQPAASSARQS